MRLKLLKIAEALKREGIPMSPKHVARMARRGLVPAVLIGSHYFVNPAELRAALIRPAQVKAKAGK